MLIIHVELDKNIILLFTCMGNTRSPRRVCSILPE